MKRLRKLFMALLFVGAGVGGAAVAVAAVSNVTLTGNNLACRQGTSSVAASGTVTIADGKSVTCSAAANPPANVLAGNTVVQATPDGGQGTTEAFGYTASASGAATGISVYLTSTDGVAVGLYADQAGKPGGLLDKASVASNSSGWVSVPLSAGVQISQGTRYWLAISALSASATVNYRDAGTGGSNLDYSSGSGLADPYVADAQWNSNPASVYLTGGPAASSSSSSSSSSSTSTTTSTTTTSTTDTTPTTTTTATTPTPPSSGTYTLPADRTYDWNPGLNSVGGIPNRTTVYQTISPSGGDDTATIQAALDSCPANQVVKLTAGVFHISGQGLNLDTSDCTLRGAGPGPGNWPAGIAASGTGGTYLEKPTGSNYPVIVVGHRFGGSGTAINLTADAVRGTKTATVASTSGLAAGDLVVVNELTDPTISHWERNAQTFTGWFDEVNRPLGDILQIASISGNTLTFTTDLPTTYKVSQSAHLFTVDGQIEKAGVEDLYVYGGEGGDGGGGMHVWNCAYCWIKHVEDTWSVGAAVHVDQSFGTEIRDSYFHDCEGDNLSSGGSCYGIGLNWYTSHTLVENNILIKYNKVDVMRSAGGGNVFAYSYLDDGADNQGQWQEGGVGTSHFPTPHYELVEGNQSFDCFQEDTWGNSAYITFLRNQCVGFNRDFAQYGPHTGIGIEQWNWWQSFVGNVIGNSTDASIFTDGYEVIGGGFASAIWNLCNTNSNAVGEDDGGKCVATMLRDGNYDYLSKEVHWHGIGGTGVNNGLTPPANATLPDSLYLTAKPAFFGSSPWPWVDGSNAANPLPGQLPARTRYDAGTPNTVQ